MKSIFSLLSSVVRRHWIISSLIGVAIVGGIGIGIQRHRQTTTNEYETAIVKRSSIRQIVSVTGTVKPNALIEIRPEISGIVASVTRKAGDPLAPGEEIFALRNTDQVLAQQQAEANYRAMEAVYDQLRAGAKPEDINVAQTTLRNAQLTLQKAQETLAVVTTAGQLDVDYANQKFATSNENVNRSITETKQQFDSALAAVFTQAESALSVTQQSLSGTIEPLLQKTAPAPNTHQRLEDLNSDLYHASSRPLNDALSRLPTVRATLISLEAQSSDAIDVNAMRSLANDIVTVIREGLDAAGSTQQLFSSLTGVFTASDIQTIGASISVEVTKMTAAQTSFQTARDNFLDIGVKRQTSVDALKDAQREADQNVRSAKEHLQTSIDTAKSSIVKAQNDVESFKAQLTLKQSAATKEELEESRARMLQAQVQWELAKRDVEKTILRSPVAGVLGDIEPTAGERIDPSTVVAKIVSNGAFELEANIPEADIATVKPSQTATVTFDALPAHEHFDATVATIDPASTVVDGVVYYKTVFALKSNDPRIKSGMTANIDVTTGAADNALVIPQRAVRSEEGAFLVTVMKNSNTTEDKRITTGLRGEDGTVEVRDGLNEGDVIVTFVKKK